MPSLKNRGCLVLQLLVTIVVHSVFLFAAFEVYFPSTVFSEVEVYANTTKPYAKRIVMVISDGLRADLLYNLSAPKGKTRKTFIRTVMEEKGVWGVSHAAVPSKSEEGVTAIAAGQREEPVALFYRFIRIPVEIDNVFKRAKKVIWAGEPKVPDYFGDAKNSWILHTWNFSIWSFAASWSNYSIADEWAFYMMEKILHNKSEAKGVETDGAIFVVYLDATDASAHMWTPLSPGSINAVRLIDRQLNRITKVFQNRFHDNSTAFLFTSDHGMLDKGSHGGGTGNETQTPFVLWGSGIIDQKTAKERDKWMKTKWNSSSLWEVESLKRFDIWQTDLSPLIATLIGVPIPAHSKGRLPYFVLNSSNDHIALSLYMNYLQLARLKDQVADRFRTGWINGLLRSQNEEWADRKAANLVVSFWKHYTVKDYEKAIKEGKQLVDSATSALNIYSSYLANLMSWVIIMAMSGWSIILIGCGINGIKPISLDTKPSLINNSYYILGSILMSALMITATFTQHWPLRYSIYLLANVWIWCGALIHVEKLIRYPWRKTDLVWVSWIFFGVIIAICITNIRRPVFRQAVIILWLLGIVMVMVRLKMKAEIILGGMATSLMLRDAIERSIIHESVNLELLQLGTVVWICVGTLYIVFQNPKSSGESLVLVCFFALLMLGSWNILEVVNLLEQDKESNTSQITLSWTLLALSIILSLFMKINEHNNLFCYACAFGTVFSLLSVRQESGSFGLYCFLLITWHSTQKKWATAENKVIWMFGADPPVVHRIRLGIEHMVAYYVVFFIAGNDITPTTFSIYWTRAFHNTFNETTMAILVIIKISIPFIFTSYIYNKNESEMKVPLGEQVKWFLFFNSIIGNWAFYHINIGFSWHSLTTALSIHVMAQLASMSAAGLLILGMCFETFFWTKPAIQKRQSELENVIK